MTLRSRATLLRALALALPAHAQDAAPAGQLQANPSGGTTVTLDPAPTASADEAAQVAALEEAARLLRDKRIDEALAILDRTISHSEAKYSDPDTRWYVARDGGDSLAYMVMSAADVDAGKAGGKTKAQALLVQWANAWYLKGYALVEAKRLDEARTALDRALELSPWNALFLTERGELAKLERKWTEALAYYESAEEFATFSGDDAERDRAKAMRGQAFALVEMGELDKAQKVLKAVLKIDPNDQRAKDELEYIKQARAAQK